MQRDANGNELWEMDAISYVPRMVGRKEEAKDCPGRVWAWHHGWSRNVGAPTSRQPSERTQTPCWRRRWTT